MIVEVATLCIVLAQDPHKCEAGERILSLNSPHSIVLTVTGSDKPLILDCGVDLQTAMAHDLALVPEVAHVMVESAEANLLVWIAVDNPTKEVREKIFQKEMSLIDGFPEVEFDFNIIFARGRSPMEFASSAKVIYSRGDIS
jgi:hypothetical protein